tara:strand:- start:338 stop:892 length:555 start_codon:yes stop_codon:yes gene_type:complete
MAEDYANIDRGIKKMVEDLTVLTSDKVVLANQNGPRPDLPYISFERVNEQPMQRNEFIAATDTVDAKIQNVKRSTVRFQAYSNTQREPFELLDDLTLGQDNSVVIDDIRTTYGFNVLNYGKVTDISSIMTQHIEPRAFIDFTIIYKTVKVLTGTAGCIIEHMSGDGILKDAVTGDRNITYNVDT